MNKLLPLAAVAALTLPVATASATPHAHISKTCNVSDATATNFFGNGTYLFKDNLAMHATGVSCGKAIKVARAYGTCNRSKSTCHKTVKGLSCSQKLIPELNNGKTYGATVTCHKGSNKVVYSYGVNG
ncbi:MAG: hypothetical protein QOF76_528 [Solirubrobacteraceae bacterium]|jgi:hypothetical protein|nr:hypothetical protein [Solirubrobacteraceae bacterium]